MSAKQSLETMYVVDPFDEGEDDDDDDDWEDVALSATPSWAMMPEPEPEPVTSRHAEDLQITFDTTTPRVPAKRARAGRKTLSAAERKLRLDAHKAHLLCLLAHVSRRNAWCNDPVVQKHTSRIFPPNVVRYLTPPKHLPTFSRSTTFVDGLRRAVQVFHSTFKVTEPGMRRPFWLENPQELSDPAKISQCDAANTEIVSSLEDFRQQADHLKGSRDLGAQLFCAFLRGVGVPARIVCSLQVLPFDASSKIPAVPVTPETPRRPQSASISPAKEPEYPADVAPTRVIPESSPKRRRLGQPSFGKRRAPPPPPMRDAPVPKELPKPPARKPAATPSESPCPVFWVEVYNEAVQKWLAIDPVVTATISDVARLEPSAGDRFNAMKYVVAFDSDASARDVTPRYTSAFISRMLKLRVDHTPTGKLWWQAVMDYYSKPLPDERDDVEDEELAAKLATEPMPRSIQDFKGHPKYALERHLRRNEIIHPKTKVADLPANQKGEREAVYRREDVHIVRSAEGWYRLGRQLNIGEQPAKKIRAMGSKAIAANIDDSCGGVTEVSLYSEAQTHIYKPPPIVDGRVTKNDYGNIDVFVPSMVPEAGFHVAHPDASRAARILGIDYADAVTGFHFKGRHGTAVVEGIVAALEYREALLVILQALDEARVQAERDERTSLVLRTWKMLLVKLRIQEQVESYAFEGEEEGQAAATAEGYGQDDKDDDDDGFAGGGGFIPDPDA